MLTLIGKDGDNQYTFELRLGKQVLGRRQDCDLCINNKTVSRQHAELEVLEAPPRLRLTDLDSHNGTLLNDEVISGTVEVRSGDRITVGEIELEVVDSEEGVASAPPTLTERGDTDLQKSIILPIGEALRPLPTAVVSLPQVMAVFTEMARMLVLPEPLESMLGRALALIAKVVPADRYAVLSVADNAIGVTCAATYAPAGGAREAFNLSRTIIADILTSRTALVISDVQRDIRFAQQHSVIMSGLKSAMAVPLFDEDKVLGILYVDTADPRPIYTDEYLKILATFGNILGSRLLNFTLLAERQQKKLMEAEIRRAAEIQKGLLTQVVPEVAGYAIHAFLQQSQLVGGDFYDLTPLPDGRLIFMVGDVSGKGMGAALLMSNILASFRILYRDPEFELLRTVNLVSKELCAHCERGNFATLFTALFDPTTHRLSYVNAGHNSPIVVRAEGRHQHLDASGPMIGVFDDATWRLEEVEFGVGDLLFVFTDGVPEARRETELYSDERLEQQVLRLHDRSPEDVVRGLMTELEGFLQGTPYSDDITMLTLKRLD